jgi:hypothetical protein
VFSIRCVFPFAIFVCCGHHHFILVYFPSVMFSFCCVCSLWSLFRYVLFYLPVSLEFIVFVHCDSHRIILVYFPSILFSALPCVFVMIVIISTLYVFDYLSFPFAVFVHCGHNSNLVDESGFSEEIHYVHCLLLVIFQ